MGFSRKEYWSGLPFPPPGHLPNPGIDPRSLILLHWQVGSLTTSSTSEAPRTGGPSHSSGLIRDLLDLVGLPPWLSGKESASNAGHTGDASLIPGWEGSSGVGNDNPLQYSFLENPMDRRACRATVHRVPKSWTQLRDFTFTTVGIILKIIYF